MPWAASVCDTWQIRERPGNSMAYTSESKTAKSTGSTGLGEESRTTKSGRGRASERHSEVWG